MDSSKRQFLQQLGVPTTGASLVPLAQAQFPYSPERWEGSQQYHYAMLVDLQCCIGCQACTVSCAIENQTPQGEFRTLINQYQAQIEGQQSVINILLPRPYNHCDNPPCVSVCSVQVTFQYKDGTVAVDNTRCVDCAYYVQAHPYDTRFINCEAQVADRCTFCAHRLEVGLLPACVESCVGGMRIIGDIKDPHSCISQMLHEHHDAIRVLKPEDGTSPNVFYLGLDEVLVTPPMG